ncbi:Voltage-dependent anion channel [Lasallia pustulata]|uniref:Voltage-dependent anion channel n=1 Tax=Lasallia pustulata TaxID=136370 RepID=A0A1W5CV98_9LECA|nr:Voltage-dependent anion channel [Lasallia pustulata]
MEHDRPAPPSKVSLHERLHHFTWAWFTLTMSTGGISLLLSVLPHRFRGLTTIGTTIFILDLVLFIVLTNLITARFILHRGSFTRSLNHPTESLFIPTFWLTIATLGSNIQQYGVPSSGPWLLVAVRVLFWTYSACTFASAILQYHLLFTGKPLTIQSMTPAWLLPIFPVMLCGTLASVTAGAQPSHHGIPIIIAGVTFQGVGFLVAVFMYSNYVGRLMSYGLPSPNTRPGMFIAVGPPAFTALALIGMANDALILFPHTFVLGTSAVPTAQVLKILAVFMGIFLWSLAFFFFCISLVATLCSLGQMKFHLSWWSFVFPNTGLIIAGMDIGTAIGSEATRWTMSGVAVLQIGIWLVVACFHARAVWRGEIMWPGRDEDHDQ